MVTKMATKDAATVYAEIVEAAAKNSPEVRDARKLMDVPGDVVRQGDVYVWRMPDCFEPVGTPRGERQVAVGNTAGSRHIAEGEGVKLTNLAEPAKMADALRRLGGGATLNAEMIGPVVRSESEWTLTHPEHAHVRFAAGCYAVTYQWDERAAARVRD